MANFQDIIRKVKSHLSSDQSAKLVTLKTWLEEIDVTDWKQKVSFCNEHYNRVIIHQEELFEVILICWKGGQASSIHDHPNRGCLVKILQGCLNDEVFSNNESFRNEYPLKSVLHISNQIGVHKMENKCTEDAISLHIYAPGFYKPNFIDRPQVLAETVNHRSF